MTSTVELIAAPRPVRVTVIDDSDLAQVGVRALLEPFAERVAVIDNAAALAAPADVDLVLFEPRTRSSMSLSMMRDLHRRGDAVIAAYSWADPADLPSTLPQLSKTLTASQLTVEICSLVAARPSAGLADDLADTVEALTSYRAQRAPRREQEARPDRPAADPAHAGLTGREHDVLRLVAQGCTNIEIGEALDLSINSVKTYIRTTYRKIGVARRSQAVIWAIAHGIGEPPSDDLAG